MGASERPRRPGAGDALVQAVLEWAESAGASAVRLDVVEGNTAAIGLYERNGFRFTGGMISQPATA